MMPKSHNVSNFLRRDDDWRLCGVQRIPDYERKFMIKAKRLVVAETTYALNFAQ
jgi:hypothetical protein